MDRKFSLLILFAIVCNISFGQTKISVKNDSNNDDIITFEKIQKKSKFAEFTSELGTFTRFVEIELMRVPIGLTSIKSNIIEFQDQNGNPINHFLELNISSSINEMKIHADFFDSIVNTINKFEVESKKEKNTGNLLCNAYESDGSFEFGYQIKKGKNPQWFVIINRTIYKVKDISDIKNMFVKAIEAVNELKSNPNSNLRNPNRKVQKVVFSVREREGVDYK
ncbi:MAG: hypothetical protein KBT32_06175 [Bacteroidales bacterium]|nr:hypothetical protein [Candidatus Physcocola equi]